MRLVLTMTALAVLAAPAVAGPKVEFKTSLGDFTLELDPGKAPKTVANFLDYVKAGHYDGTLFHRVISTFMVQGGGFLPGMKEREGKRAPVENEADNGLKNLRGTVAMARTSDPHSATAQFFVNVVDNAFLDHTDKSVRGYGYCVFGRVTAGIETVDKIKAVATGMVGPFQDVPKEDVVIASARLLAETAAPAAEPAAEPAAGTAPVELNAGTTPVGTN